MAAEVTVKNLQETIRGLERFAGEVEAEIEDVVDTGLSRMARALAVYPPPIPDSAYRRTGRLGAGWRTADRVFRVGPRGIDAVLANPVAYAPFVQDAEEQARVHVGRWQTVQDVQEREEAQIAQEIDAAIDRVIARLGL